MGCSSSVPLARENSVHNAKTTLFFSDRGKQYEAIHEKFNTDIYSTEFNQDLDTLEKDHTKNIDHEIYLLRSKYQSKIKKAGVTHEEFFFLVTELIGETILKKHLQLSQTDIFSLVTHIFTKELALSKDEIAKCKKALQQFETEFETNLSSMVYSIDKIIHYNPLYFKGMNRNLKYNKDYKLQILTIVISPSMFKIEDMMSDLAEIIEHDDKLQILNIILHPVKEDGRVLDSFSLNVGMYKHLYYIFCAVTKNRSIKVLFLHATKDYQIVLAPEIANLILSKLESETLTALHIGKFDLSEDFISKLLVKVVSIKSLLFLSLEYRNIIHHLVSKIQPALIRNTSLAAVALVDSKIPRIAPSIIEEFKTEVKKNNKELSVVYISDVGFINYPSLQAQAIK